MTIKKFKQRKLFFFVIMFILTGLAINQGNPALAFLAILLYMPLVSFLKTMVDGVLIDECQEQVGAKAAQTSFRVLMPILLLSSIGLLVGAGKERFEYLTGLGMILAYITCLALLIYVLMYFYFDRQTGGK